MLQQLSREEIVHILCFESDTPKTLGFTFPLVCEELHTKCNADETWEMFLAAALPTYYDYIKKHDRNVTNNGFKYTFQHLYKKWYDTNSVLQFTDATTGFVRNMKNATSE